MRSRPVSEMGSILLGACVFACPLVMGVMMVAMRRGTPLRKPRPKPEAAQEANDGGAPK